MVKLPTAGIGAVKYGYVLLKAASGTLPVGSALRGFEDTFASSDDWDVKVTPPDKPSFARQGSP